MRSLTTVPRALVALVLASGCTRANPAFGDSETDGSTTTSAATSVSGTSQGATTRDSSPSGSGPTVSSSDPSLPSDPSDPSAGSDPWSSSGTMETGAGSGDSLTTPMDVTAGEACSVPEPCEPATGQCEIGQRCLPYTDGVDQWVGWACLERRESPGVGLQPCSAACDAAGPHDTCGGRLACWNEHCELPCNDDVPCGAPLLECSVTGNTEIGVCQPILPACHPFGGGVAMCNGGAVCSYGRPDLVCETEFGGGLYGDVCALAMPSCGAGLFCVPDNDFSGCAGAACCTSFCNPAFVCPDNNVCVSVFGGFPPVGVEDFGICGAPP